MTSERLGHVLPHASSDVAAGPRWRIAIARPGGRTSQITMLRLTTELRAAGCMVIDLPVAVSRSENLDFVASLAGAAGYDVVLGLGGCHEEAARLAAVFDVPLVRLAVVPGDLAGRLPHLPLLDRHILDVRTGHSEIPEVVLDEMAVRPAHPGSALELCLSGREPVSLPSLTVGAPDADPGSGAPFAPSTGTSVHVRWPDPSGRASLALPLDETLRIRTIDDTPLAVSFDGGQFAEVDAEVVVGPNRRRLRFTPVVGSEEGWEHAGPTASRQRSRNGRSRR